MSIHWAKIIADRQQDFELPNLPMRIEVPRPPQCVAEFIQCVDRPATPLSELGGIIEKDTEIASSVLRIVNGSQLMLKVSSIYNKI